MAEVVSYRREGKIALITVDNPPVNALSLPVRAGLAKAFTQFAADGDAAAAVLICAGRTFIAGADITEFDKPIEEPWLPKVIHQIEDCAKPVVAAIHGTALGGGLETAMGCHYRVAVATAQVGLPEVSLGLLPGATGTQRLPRLIGVKNALDAMISGRPLPAKKALELGAIDQIVDGDLQAGAIAFAEKLIADGKGPRRVRDIPVDAASLPADFFAEYRKSIARETRGFFAPEQIVKCVEAAVSLPYADAVARENELFMTCMHSTHSKAQRHLFFAEREVAKIPDVPKDTALRPIKQVAVIGGGTMGGGIAMNFANVGIPVLLKEISQEALDRGMAIIRGNYEGPVKKGKLTQEKMDQCMALITPTLNYDDIKDCDLVIEAVFETMAIKKEVFGTLDKVCKQGAILASNTSTLDIDAIAACTNRPQDVIGLHFFAPANVMSLLEIVRGAKTSNEVIATSMAMAKTIRKMGVLVRVCFGFVGNRMLAKRTAQVERLLLEGALPAQVDQALTDFGFRMGPCAMSDLAGLDIGWRIRQATGKRAPVADALVEAGRLGQKTGKGFFLYPEGSRAPVPDPEVAGLIAAASAREGVARRAIEQAEILDRLLLPMVNEGARILEEGIAARPGDIDVVWLHGYGWPAWTGGPMHWAGARGLAGIAARLEQFAAGSGDESLRPAPLLAKLAAEGRGFG